MDLSVLEKFIKKAKANGFFVAANYMKSYALKPKKFAQKVKESVKFGVPRTMLEPQDMYLRKPLNDTFMNRKSRRFNYYNFLCHIIS